MTDRQWEFLAEKIEAGLRPERERRWRAAINRRTARRRTLAFAGAAVAVLAVLAGGAGPFIVFRGHTAAAPIATLTRVAADKRDVNVEEGRVRVHAQGADAGVGAAPR